MAHASHHHNIFSQLYHATVTPFYEWLADKLGGREAAGRVGRYSRITRVAVNIVSLCIIFAVLVGVGLSGFMTSGAALPLWAGITLLACMVINSLAIVAGAAGNHLKITQYYDMEVELHAFNDWDALEPTPIPNTPQKKMMRLMRGLHDLNGFGGSVLSALLAVPVMFAVVGVSTWGFVPLVAFALFTASRASALVSAAGAWFTNQYRLSAYKKSINAEMIKYQDSTLSRYVSLIDNVLSDLHLTSSQPYVKAVKFFCLRGLEDVTIEDGAAFKNALKDKLQKLMDNGCFSRDKLSTLSGKPEAIWDALHQLEMDVFCMASGKTLPSSGLPIELQYYAAKYDKTIADTTGYKSETMTTQYPINNTAHGVNFCRFYHGKRFVAKIGSTRP